MIFHQIVCFFLSSRNYNFNRFSVQGFYFCYWKQNTICVILLLLNLISLMRKQFAKIRCVLKNSVWVALNHRWFLFHSLILREEQKQYVSSGSSISLLPIFWGWDWQRHFNCGRIFFSDNLKWFHIKYIERGSVNMEFQIEKFNSNLFWKHVS